MKELKLAGHKVRLYDSIEELPICRFHAYNRMLLIDAGIGSDINDFDAHIERAVRYIRNNDRENAAKEMENMRQNIFMVMQETNVRHLSFACLVESIDGERTDDLSKEALSRVVERLGGAKTSDVSDLYESVKKKIDEQLMLYFPSLFNDVRTREFYDTMKRLAVETLRQITDEGADTTENVEKLREKMILFSAPKRYTGHDGMEVQHDKSFEAMCITITKETGREAKRMSVMEFYSAHEYIVKMSKKSRRAQNKAV